MLSHEPSVEDAGKFIIDRAHLRVTLC